MWVFLSYWPPIDRWETPFQMNLLCYHHVAPFFRMKGSHLATAWCSANIIDEAYQSVLIIQIVSFLSMGVLNKWGRYGRKKLFCFYLLRKYWHRGYPHIFSHYNAGLIFQTHQWSYDLYPKVGEMKSGFPISHFASWRTHWFLMVQYSRPKVQCL